MNERIKTMWVEATGSVWPRPYKFTAGEYDTHLEKFAELIVRECMTICGAIQGAGESRNMSDFASGAAQCKAIIKRDFGVE